MLTHVTALQARTAILNADILAPVVRLQFADIVSPTSESVVVPLPAGLESQQNRTKSKRLYSEEPLEAYEKDFGDTTSGMMFSNCQLARDGFRTEGALWKLVTLCTTRVDHQHNPRPDREQTDMESITGDCDLDSVIMMDCVSPDEPLTPQCLDVSAADECQGLVKSFDDLGRRDWLPYLSESEAMEALDLECVQIFSTLPVVVAKESVVPPVASEVSEVEMILKLNEDIVQLAEPSGDSAGGDIVQRGSGDIAELAEPSGGSAGGDIVQRGSGDIAELAEPSGGSAGGDIVQLEQASGGGASEQLSASLRQMPASFDMADPEDPDDEELVAFILANAYGCSPARKDQLAEELKMLEDVYISKVTCLNSSKVLQLKRNELQDRLQFVKQVRPPGLDDPRGVPLIDVPSTAFFDKPPSVKWWLMFNQPGTDRQQFCELHFEDDGDEFFITSVDDRQAGGVQLYIHVRRAGQPYPILSNLHRFHSVVFLLRVGSAPKVLIRDVSHNKFTACICHTDGTYVMLHGVPSVWRNKRTNKEMFDRAERYLLNKHWKAPVILSHGCELKYMQSPLYTSTFHRNKHPLKIFLLDGLSCRVQNASSDAVFSVAMEDTETFGLASSGGLLIASGSVTQPCTTLMRESLPAKLADPRFSEHFGTLGERYEQFPDSVYRAASLSVFDLLPTVSKVFESDLKVVHAGLYRSQAAESRTAQRVKAMHDCIMISCFYFFFILAFRQQFEKPHRSMFAALSLSMSLNKKEEVTVTELMQYAHEWLEDVEMDDFVSEGYPVFRNGSYVNMTVFDLYREGVLVEMDPHGDWSREDRAEQAFAMFEATVKAFSFTGNLVCIDRLGFIVEMTAKAERAMLELLLVALADHLEIVIELVTIGGNGMAELVKFKEGVRLEVSPARDVYFLIYDSDEFLVLCDRNNVDGKYFQ